MSSRRLAPLPASGRNHTGVTLDGLDLGSEGPCWYGVVLAAIDRAAPPAPVDSLTETARDDLLDQLTDAGASRVLVDVTPRRGGHGHVVVSVSLAGGRKVVEEGARLGPALRRTLRALSRVSASPGREATP